MSAQYKSKAEVKAEQTSQDKPSQDASNGSIPTIQGLQTSQEALYAGHRMNARLITQGIKVQAYIDEFESAIDELNQGEVQPDFLKALQRDYAPALTQNQVLMPLLSQSLSPVGAEKSLTDDDEQLALINVLMQRCRFLRERALLGSITNEECKELDAIVPKLLDMGVIV